MGCGHRRCLRRGLPVDHVCVGSSPRYDGGGGENDRCRSLDPRAVVAAGARCSGLRDRWRARPLACRAPSRAARPPPLGPGAGTAIGAGTAAVERGCAAMGDHPFRCEKCWARGAERGRYPEVYARAIERESRRKMAAYTCPFDESVWHFAPVGDWNRHGFEPVRPGLAEEVAERSRYSG